jgi:hypothetical protein
MIKIEPHYNQQKMTFSGGRGSGWRGWSVLANNTAEVKLAIEHYIGSGNDSHVVGSKKNCPLCRKVNEEREKEAKKGRRSTTKV